MVMDLRQWVAHRIADDPELNDDVGLLILSALEGDSALDGYIADGVSPLQVHELVKASDDEAEPIGAFLKSLDVEGFRGVNERLTLALAPQPGLTIIAGRNGSGKSSLAEALEVALTGSTYRWKNKAAQWKEHWRNLHHSDPVEIVVKIVEEHVGVTTLATSWPAGVEDVTDSTSWVQRPGAKRQPDLTSLGWSGALDTYRPMMSYDELGGMLEAGPSTLYDALSKALGVEQITDAIGRLDQRSKVLKAPGETLATRRKVLQAEAAALSDERAPQVTSLLKKSQPDVGALRALATGAVVVDTGPLGQLRALESLAAPSRVDVAAAAVDLRGAVEGMVRAGEAELASPKLRLL